MNKYKECLIVIPARYASKRLEGKPLIKILGKEMVQRVYENAMLVANKLKDVSVVVATDDSRILEFCNNNNINALLIDAPCRSGTQRVINTLLKINDSHIKYVINLQGDNPLCPPWFIENIINVLKRDENADIVTPCVNLTWENLDNLKKIKESTPFSGTTVVFNDNFKALWFSKQIIPAIRNEKEYREQSNFSPVYRHVGLYGFKADILLNKISGLSETKYERLEGLEQLSWLENNLSVKVIIADYKGRSEMSGVDTKDDLLRAESIIKKEGDFKVDYYGSSRFR
ncbi:MAG: 3-deoxy-manno-octulosonate cytidylyltransferase [Bdellovibrionota bacterium]|jgi:3-deoxy-manno-octulosonate cytidylyltransferase (CMP-KDO synthetase)